MPIDYAEKYDVAGGMEASLLGKAKSFTLASFTDVATSLYNSLPFVEDVRTEDWLDAIDKDAVSFYQANPDAVHLTSLIGGALLPGGVALKLLNRARTGVKALGFTEGYIGGSFSGFRQKKLATEIEEAFRAAGPGNTEYQRLKRQLIASNIGQQVIDNSVIELAVVGAMNAHPYMEDYIQDFGTNFAIGVAAGGVLGGLFSLPGSFKTLRFASAAGERQAISGVLDESSFKPLSEGLTNSSKAMLHKENIKNLEAFVATKEHDDYSRQIAVHTLGLEQTRLVETIENAFPTFSKLEKEEQNIISEIMTNPNFSGVDKVKFLNITKIAKESPKLIDFGKFPELKDLDPNKPFVFYRPSTKEVFASTGVRNAITAADFPDAAKLIISKAKEIQFSYNNPVPDFIEDNILRTVSSAETDLRYLAELVAMDKLDITKLSQVAVANGDLPRMHALAIRALKLSPEELADVKVIITRDRPSHALQQTVIKRIIEEEKQFAPTYLDDIHRITSSGNNSIYDTGLSPKSIELLDYFVTGRHNSKLASEAFGVPRNLPPNVNSHVAAGIGGFRRAFNAFFRSEALPPGEEKWVDAAREIYAKGQAYRDQLKTIANADGEVVLFRGIKAQEPRGHSAVESYSSSYRIAKAFAGGNGHVIVAKVHVDNVIAAVGKRPYAEYEILVGAPKQTPVEGGFAGIPLRRQGQSQTSEFVDELIEESNLAPGRKQISLADLMLREYPAALQDAVEQMKGKFSLEEISARLGITRDAALVLSNGGQMDFFRTTAYRYTSAEKIKEYVGIQNKLIMLAGNAIRRSNAAELAGLDRKELAVANREIVDQLTDIYRSPIASRIKGIYDNKGGKLKINVLVSELSEIANSLVGNHRWQSADQALRMLANGPTITGLGKLFTNNVDRLKEEILIPLATALQPLRENPAALVELNQVLNKLAGLKGWRDIREIGQDTAGNPIFGIIQRTGEKAEDGTAKFSIIQNADGSNFTIQQEAVKNALEAMRAPANILYKTHNLNRSIIGANPVNDLGFYVPPVALVGKSYSFVFDKTGELPTQMLIANNAEELKSLEQAWKTANATELTRFDLVPKGSQADYNRIKQYEDFELHTTYANVAFQHKGATVQAILPSDFRMIENMLQSYENLILQSARKYHEHYLHDVTSWLDDLSSFYNREVKGQPKRDVEKEVAKDAALQIKNILLGRDQLESTVFPKKLNTLYELGINRAVQAVDDYFKTPIARKQTTTDYYNKLISDLDQKGIQNPWQSFDEYLATTSANARNIAPIVQSVGNGLLATMTLRMFEVAQATVNLISLPILTWGSLMDKLPATAVGSAGIKFPLRVMYDGIRFMNSQEGKAINAFWEKEGLIDQAVRQYTDFTSDLKRAYLGGRFSDHAIQLAQGVQDNPIVKNFISRPADWAEQVTRKIVMNIGYTASKQAHPGIDDFGATIAAMNFADRSIGNYHAVQRPTLFHGTFGSAIGLFQTYFLTYAQQVYRGIETKNFKQLAAVMASQTGAFGISSWPGYNLLSEQIIGQFSDKHWDITTGTYRAVGDPVAELILYGLPSSIGPSLFTRGELSPRVPSGLQDIAIYNGIRQGWESAATIVQKSAAGLQNGNLGQSLMEALSLQSLNRPIARWAELVSGESITTQGNTVSSSVDVWTPTGVFARLIGTRPLEEQVTRNAVRKNKFYEQVDFENRQAAVEKLKIALRAGNLDNDKIGDTALKYFKAGGSSQGWTSAMNELMLKTEEGTRWDLLRKLEPDSPIRRMIDELY